MRASIASPRSALLRSSKDSEVTCYDLSWTGSAAELTGPGFERFQTELSKYNGRQLNPAVPHDAWREELDIYGRILRAEGEYVEAVREEISPSHG